MEILFHLANILHVFSYLVTDILWLRALVVGFDLRLPRLLGSGVIDNPSPCQRR